MNPNHHLFVQLAIPSALRGKKYATGFQVFHYVMNLWHLFYKKKNTNEGSYTDGRRPGPNLSRLKGKHYPYKDTSVRKPCVVCYSMKSADNKRKDTKVSTYCQKCKEYML